jgi:hypothetical protein
MVRAAHPWVIIAAESDPRDTADIPLPFRPRSAEGCCDLASAHRWARAQTLPSRILPIVREQDQPWWSRVIASVPAVNVVEEPIDRGSGPGLLVAALRVSGWDPQGELIAISTHRDRPWPEIFDALERMLRAPRSVGELRVNGPTAVGHVGAFLAKFRETQPELYLAFHQRRGSVWNLASVYPYLDCVDAWSEVLSVQTSPEKQLTMA